MTKAKLKSKERYIPMTFSLHAQQLDAVIDLSHKYNIPQSHLIRAYIAYFNDHPEELEKLMEVKV